MNIELLPPCFGAQAGLELNVAQAGLKLHILLPEHPECWVYRWVPPCLAQEIFFVLFEVF